MMPLGHRICDVVQQFVTTRTVSAGVTVLKQTDSKQQSEGVLRMWDSEHGAVVVKVFNRQRIRDKLKRMVGRGNALNEWSMHCYARSRGVAVPEPLCFNTVESGNTPSVDVIVVQELAGSHKGLQYFKQLLETTDDSAIANFESQLIQLTGDLVAAGMTDTDHQLNNILVDSAGTLCRIDFECAHRHRSRRKHDRDLGWMLGRLLASHVFACQPDLESSVAFARCLTQALNPPARSLKLANQRLEQTLARQKSLNGVDSALKLAW